MNDKTQYTHLNDLFAFQSNNIQKYELIGNLDGCKCNTSNAASC